MQVNATKPADDPGSASDPVRADPPAGSGSIAPPGSPPPEPIPHEWRVAAAERLLSESASPRHAAARRFVEMGPTLGVDFDLFWGTLRREHGRVTGVGEACLAVPGPGRTAMLFLSVPLSGPEGPDAPGHAERVEVVRQACVELARHHRQRVRLAQALIEPTDPWAVRAYRDAGFTHAGDLLYLRRALDRTLSDAARPAGAWPEGVRVRTVAGAGPRDADRGLLVQALDASYRDTLDCPELCGLRLTEDVLDSHRAAGQHDPSLWWLVTQGERAVGCALFSRFPEQRSAELVYLGLAPELRGRGVARRLLALGLSRLASMGSRACAEVHCAVDTRNAPALALYDRAGFRRVGARVAMVRPI